MASAIAPAERDQAFILHPFTNLRTHQETGPLVIDRGSGVFVSDMDGNRYLEAMSGLWCTALGFDEPRLAQAAMRQFERLPFYHMFGQKVHEPGIDLAEQLIALAPVPMSKVFFANSGSEANDSAVKLIWYFNNAVGRPKKKKLIARGQAYHGVTVAAASLTGIPINHRAFDLPIANILHTDCPHWYRHAEPGESEEEFATRLAQSLENLILAEGPDTVAAFFAEPVQGAGGVIVPPRTYFEKIQAVLRKYDVLLVADEVICGFGRTGNWWGSQTFDLKPDILTCAKALSSAYLPISAVLVSAPIYAAVEAESSRIGTFGHGFTYSGHPVSAAVALEALSIYRERDITGHVRTLAPRLQDGLRRLADHPLVGEVRGVGLVAGVELVADKARRTPFTPALAVAPKVVALCQKHGLIVRPLGNTIAVSPPLVITAEEIDMLIARLSAALDEAVPVVRDLAA